MLEIHRTHRAKICNHSQVADSLDRHGWSASKLWNVANYHARQVWDETGEVPDHKDLKRELKDHPKYDGLHRCTGWLAQPSVYLHDLSCGFQRQPEVVDCKP